MTGLHVLHADDGNDITGLGTVEFLAGVGVHLDDTANTLGLAGKGVQHGGAFFQLAGVDTDKGQRAKAVIHDLEGEGTQWPVGVNDGKFTGLITFQVDFRLWQDFSRVRQEVYRGIQYQLNTLVLEGGTAIGREEVERDGALANTALDILYGRFVAIQVLLQQVIVLFNRGFDQLLAPLLDQLGHVGRWLRDFIGGRITGVIPDPCLACQQVDNSAEIILDTDWQHHHQRVCVEYLLDLFYHAVEVGAEAVHLVDENDTRDARFVGITPVGFRLGFHAAGAAEDADAAIEHLQGTIDFDGEVNVSGGVNNIQAMPVPFTAGGRRLNGDAAFLFLFHEVGGCFTVMYFAGFVDLAGEFQDTLCGRRFSRINVREDTDISVLG